MFRRSFLNTLLKLSTLLLLPFRKPKASMDIPASKFDKEIYNQQDWKKRVYRDSHNESPLVDIDEDYYESIYEDLEMEMLDGVHFTPCGGLPIACHQCGENCDGRRPPNPPPTPGNPKQPQCGKL